MVKFQEHGTIFERNNYGTLCQYTEFIIMTLLYCSLQFDSSYSEHQQKWLSLLVDDNLLLCIILLTLPELINVTVW